MSPDTTILARQAPTSSSSNSNSDDEESSASSGDGHGGVTRLFIGNLVPALSDAVLKASLSKFGSVISIERNGERNFAHVSLSTASDEQLKRCISTLNQTRWMGTVVRVEAATEHFMARLKREWAAHNTTNNNKSEQPGETQEVDHIPASFAWSGKHTIFPAVKDDYHQFVRPILRDDTTTNAGDGNDNDDSAAVREEPKPSNIDAAAADLFGLAVEAPPTKYMNNNTSDDSKRGAAPTNTTTTKAPTNTTTTIDSGTADLFGLGWEAEAVEIKKAEIKSVAPPKGAACENNNNNIIINIKEASKADLANVTAIGNDPSKINLAAEHQRQRNIIAQLFGANNNNNATAGNYASNNNNRVKSKALYLRFENNINKKNNNSCVGVPKRPFHIDYSIVTGRRKGLYRNISKSRRITRTIPKVH